MPTAAHEPDTAGGGVWKAGALIFGLALLLRIFFLYATPDSSWPYSSYYRGDADSWIEYARAIHDGSTYEMGLPTKPPGTAWLIAALWNGRDSGIPLLKLVWCLMGAGTVAKPRSRTTKRVASAPKSSTTILDAQASAPTAPATPEAPAPARQDLVAARQVERLQQKIEPASDRQASDRVGAAGPRLF